MNAIVVDRPGAGQSDNPNIMSRGKARGWIKDESLIRLRDTSLLILTLLFLLLSAVGSAFAQVPLRSVAQLTVDDDGRPLNYPSAVFYDPVEEEIYLVNGGTSRVVVYGPDFFPAVSIGVGRGVEAPRGGLVLPNGQVYLCQVRNVKSARPRITILNGAFFVEREIFLDEIPETANVIPRDIARSRDGLIYLAGANNRGVFILDDEGNFLRRLRPLDRTLAPVEPEERLPEELPDTVKDIAEVGSSGHEVADIPEEFRPRGGVRGRSSGGAEDLNPVRVNHVSIDSQGRIYLLSAETSKVYVYGPDESFLFAFGEKGGTPRRMSQPRALAIDESRGLIYVADYMRHTILVYNMEGEYRFEFGGRGVAPGWFNFPEDIAINNQNQLIISDLFNRRVQVLEVLYDEFSPSLKVLVESGEEQTVVPQDSAPFVEIIESSPERSDDQELVDEPPAEGPDAGEDAPIEEMIFEQAPLEDLDGSTR